MNSYKYNPFSRNLDRSVTPPNIYFNTQANTNIYIDGLNGNDDTGN